jgi:hypothetical protein
VVRALQQFSPELVAILAILAILARLRLSALAPVDKYGEVSPERA